MPRRPRTWPALRKGTIARSATLVVGAEVVANVACWVTALGLFAPDPGKRRVLSLACVAWTLVSESHTAEEAQLTFVCGPGAAARIRYADARNTHDLSP